MCVFVDEREKERDCVFFYGCVSACIIMRLRMN